MSFQQYISDIKQVVRFSRRDIQRKYLGSILGIVWAVIQPLTTFTVIYLVFEFGFKVNTVPGDISFAIWLVAAMLPWFYVSDVINSSCFAVIEHGAVIKKMIVKTELLPLVKVFSGLMLHLILLSLVLPFCLVVGLRPHLGMLMLIYYVFCATCFVVSISFLTSSITVFLRDFSQVIGLTTQIGFWATPIFWSASLVSEENLKIVMINPVFYITEGYRNSILGVNEQSLDTSWTLYFWGCTIMFFILGTHVFRKMKNHFSEVL